MKYLPLLPTAASALLLFGACTIVDDPETSGAGGSSNASGGSAGSAGSDPTGMGGLGSGGTAAEDPAIPDPAPEHSAPGAYGCDGCPDSDRTSFELDVGSATSTTLSGTVNGVEGEGTYYLRGPGGEALAGIVPINAGDGSYSIELPLFCGEQLLKLLWTNIEGTPSPVS